MSMWPWVAAVSKAVAFTEFVVIANEGKACNSSFKTSAKIKIQLIWSLLWKKRIYKLWKIRLNNKCVIVCSSTQHTNSNIRNYIA
jgi:hypothetical protein